MDKQKVFNSDNLNSTISLTEAHDDFIKTNDYNNALSGVRRDT